MYSLRLGYLKKNKTQNIYPNIDIWKCITVISLYLYKAISLKQIAVFPYVS